MDGWTITMACEQFTEAGMPIDRKGFRELVSAARRTGHLMPAGWERTGKPGHPEPFYSIADLQHLHRDIAPWISVQTAELM